MQLAWLLSRLCCVPFCSLIVTTGPDRASPWPVSAAELPRTAPVAARAAQLEREEMVLHDGGP
jgi:hypothetical protein